MRKTKNAYDILVGKLEWKRTLERLRRVLQIILKLVLKKQGTRL
jgi:hypothetical protein